MVIKTPTHFTFGTNCYRIILCRLSYHNDTNAPELGLEPRHNALEALVLPLNYSDMSHTTMLSICVGSLYYRLPVVTPCGDFTTDYWVAARSLHFSLESVNSFSP